MSINKIISTLAIAYSISKLLTEKDFNDFKLAIYKKIYEILPILDVSIEKISFLFKTNNFTSDNKTKIDEINYRIDALVSKINKENIKNIPDKLYSLLKK